MGSEEKTNDMVTSLTQLLVEVKNAALGEISLCSRAWEGHVLVEFPHPMMFFNSIHVTLHHMVRLTCDGVSVSFIGCPSNRNLICRMASP